MSLANTILQPLRLDHTDRADKNEQRTPQTGALQLFMDDTDSAESFLGNAEFQAFQQAFSRAVQIPVIDFKDVTIVNARSCTFASDDENTSALYTATATTYAYGFTMTPAQHYENHVDYEQDLRKKMIAFEHKLLKTMDSAAIAALDAAKNQSWTNLPFYSETGNALQVAAADHNDFYNKLSAIWTEFDYDGDLVNNVTNTAHLPLVERLRNQGEMNATNQAFQFNGNRWYVSTGGRIANAAGVDSTLYSVQPGNCAIVKRFTPEQNSGAIIGADSSPSKEWGKTTLLETGMEVGYLYQQDCADASAKTGGANAQSLVESWQFSVDVFYLTPYISSAANRVAPIIKAELTTA